MEKHFLADESKCSATNVNAAAVDTILVDYILFLSLQCLQVKLKLSLEISILKYIYVLPAFMYVLHMCAYCQHQKRELDPQSGITDGCEPMGVLGIEHRILWKNSHSSWLSHLSSSWKYPFLLHCFSL